MIDLPTIVEAIRKHDPTIIPSWAEDRTKSQSKCFFDYRAERPIRPECMEVMLVGWLAMGHAAASRYDLDIGRWGWHGQHGRWCAFAPQSDEPVLFEPTTRGCILAICRARGIEVDNA